MGLVAAAVQTQVGQIWMFLPQNSCVKHRPPGRRASATSAPQPAASARCGAASRRGGCPGRWEPPPGLCLLSWRASLCVWGKGEPKHSTVRAAGSQPRDQSRAVCSLEVQLQLCLQEQPGRALLCCMQMQNRKEQVKATTEKQHCAVPCHLWLQVPHPALPSLNARDAFFYVLKFAGVHSNYLTISSSWINTQGILYITYHAEYKHFGINLLIIHLLSINLVTLLRENYCERVYPPH